MVYHSDAIFSNPKEGLLRGVEFELLWLQGKQRFYSGIKQEDKNRIKMIEARLNL